MPPRLLSLLTLIEVALTQNGQIVPVTRSVDYGKGIARMVFTDGSGSIVLQNFLLADGQLCIRVDLRRSNAVQHECGAIYPQTAAFNWAAEAERIAREWIALAPGAHAPLAEHAVAASA